MSLKKFVKSIITYIRHPLISILLISKGCYNFYIGKHLTINGNIDSKNFTCKNGLYLGYDARLLFVKEYKEKKYNPEILIGENVCIGNRFSALSAAPIEIGDDCLFASDVMLTSENHGMDPELSKSYSDTILIAKPIKIGKGCWIGEKACILPGVVLGERTIVAAGAVVNKSFPPYSLVGGVPAKLIKRYNFEKHMWENINERKL